VVPRSTSIPFLSLCEKLELPPVATYAAVVLWNFKPIFAAEPLDCLENLTARMTFTGAIDESLFYLVPVAVEARGGLLIAIVMQVLHSIHSKDALFLAVHLRRLGAAIEGLPALLHRMYEKCDPQFYYDQIRPFLAGSEDSSKAGLPVG
jgi:indoleamine 2,3-dioxygenase